MILLVTFLEKEIKNIKTKESLKMGYFNDYF
jgi:hypothetical protein